MATDVLVLPENRIKVSKYVLRNHIPALQLISVEDGRERWGPVVRLGAGSELNDFGPGFDEWTLRVQFNGCFYIIFKQDLEAVSGRTRTAGA